MLACIYHSASMQMWDTESKQWVCSYVAPYHEKQTRTKVLNGMIACGNYNIAIIANYSSLCFMGFFYCRE